MKLKYVIAGLLILTTPLLAQDIQQQPRRTISVSGTAVGYATPDTIIWYIELTTTQDNVLKAKQASDGQVQSLLKILGEKGIKASQVDTGLIHVINKNSSRSSNQRSTVTSVTRNVTVRQSRLSRFADMMNTLGGSGRAKVRYEFVSSKQEEVTRKTIAKALSAAKAKANILALTADAKVGRVLNIYEYAPPDWGVSTNGIPQDAPSDVHSPDAKKIAHTVFVVFEIE